MRQKKEEKNWGWQLSSWQMFFFGGGKCPNLGVVNVRILGVVNVLLANDSQSQNCQIFFIWSHRRVPSIQFSIIQVAFWLGYMQISIRLSCWEVPPFNLLSYVWPNLNAQLNSKICKAWSHRAAKWVILMQRLSFGDNKNIQRPLDLLQLRLTYSAGNYCSKFRGQPFTAKMKTVGFQ